MRILLASGRRSPERFLPDGYDYREPEGVGRGKIVADFDSIQDAIETIDYDKFVVQQPDGFQHDDADAKIIIYNSYIE
jgi:hypothetical protein